MRLIYVKIVLILLFIAVSGQLFCTSFGLNPGDVIVFGGYGGGGDAFMAGSIREQEDRLTKSEFSAQYSSNYLFAETALMISKKMALSIGYRILWKTEGKPTDDYSASIVSDGDGGFAGNLEKDVNQQILIRYNRVHAGLIYYNSLGSFLYFPVFLRVGYNHLGEIHPSPHLGSSESISLDAGKLNMSFEPGIGCMLNMMKLKMGLIWFTVIQC